MSVATITPAHTSALPDGGDVPRLRLLPRRAPRASVTWDQVDGSSALAPLPWEPQPWEQLPLRLITAAVAVTAEDPRDEEEFGPQVTPRELLPCPDQHAQGLVRALIEVLAGDRPLAQLSRHLAPPLTARLESVQPSKRRPWAASVRSVHVSEPVPGVAEVSAVVREGKRMRAYALRLEGIDGRWLVTRLQTA